MPTSLEWSRRVVLAVWGASDPLLDPELLVAQVREHLAAEFSATRPDDVTLVRSMTAIAIAHFASDQRQELMPWGISSDPEAAFEEAVAHCALSMTVLDEHVVSIGTTSLTVRHLLDSLDTDDPRRDTIHACSFTAATVLTHAEWQTMARAFTDNGQQGLRNVLWLDGAPRKITPVVSVFGYLKRSASHLAMRQQQQERRLRLILDDEPTAAALTEAPVGRGSWLLEEWAETCPPAIAERLQSYLPMWQTCLEIVFADSAQQQRFIGHYLHTPAEDASWDEMADALVLAYHDVVTEAMLRGCLCKPPVAGKTSWATFLKTAPQDSVTDLADVALSIAKTPNVGTAAERWRAVAATLMIHAHLAAGEADGLPDPLDAESLEWCLNNLELDDLHRWLGPLARQTLEAIWAVRHMATIDARLPTAVDKLGHHIATTFCGMPAAKSATYRKQLERQLTALRTCWLAMTTAQS